MGKRRKHDVEKPREKEALKVWYGTGLRALHLGRTTGIFAANKKSVQKKCGQGFTRGGHRTERIGPARVAVSKGKDNASFTGVGHVTESRYNSPLSPSTNEVAKLKIRHAPSLKVDENRGIWPVRR